MSELLYLPVCLSSGGIQENTRSAGQMLELLGIFLIFCCVLYLAYVASRYIGKKFSVAGKSKYIKVVDRVSFGLDKHLVLVKVGKEHFLFLLGKKDFQTVAKVEIDDETAEKEQDNEEKETAFNFREIFDKYVGKDLKKTRTGPQNSQKEETPDRNETMRENIERLRKMQEKSFDKEV